MRKKLFLGLSVIWAIVIFYKAVTPFALPPGIPLFPHVDKMLHLIGFGMLAGGLFLSEYLSRRKTLLAATIYGIFIEIVQLFVGRSADILDVVADFSGAFLVVTLIQLLKKSLQDLKFIPERKRQA